MHRFRTPFSSKEKSEKSEESHEKYDELPLHSHNSEFNESNWRTHWRTLHSMPNSDVSTSHSYKQTKENSNCHRNWRTTSTRSVPVISSTYVQQSSSSSASVKLDSLKPLEASSFQAESARPYSSSPLTLLLSWKSALPYEKHGANAKFRNANSCIIGTREDADNAYENVQGIKKLERKSSFPESSEKQLELVNDECRALRHIFYSTPVLHSYNKYNNTQHEADEHYMHDNLPFQDHDNNNKFINTTDEISSHHNWRSRFAKSTQQQKQYTGVENGITSSLSLMPIVNDQSNNINDSDSRYRQSYNHENFERKKYINRPHSLNNILASRNESKNLVLSSSSPVSFSSSSLLLLPEQDLECSTQSSYSKIVPRLHFQHKHENSNINNSTTKQAQISSRARSLFASTPSKEESYELLTKEQHHEEDELTHKVSRSAHKTMTNLCAASSPSPEPYVANSQSEYEESKKLKEINEEQQEENELLYNESEQQELELSPEQNEIIHKQITNQGNIRNDNFQNNESTIFTKDTNYNDNALVVLENADNRSLQLELEELIISQLHECNYINWNSNDNNNNTKQKKLCVLDLSNINFGDNNEEQWTWFCKCALPRLFYVKELRLTNCNLSDAQLHEFAESLCSTGSSTIEQESRNSRKTYNYSYMTMSDDDYLQKQQECNRSQHHKMPYLELLDLSCNVKLTQNCVVSLTNIITFCAHSLRYLCLRHTNLADDGLHMLSNTIVTLSQNMKQEYESQQEETNNTVESEQPQQYRRTHSELVLELLDVRECNMSIHGLSETLATLSQVETLTTLLASHDINKFSEFRSIEEGENMIVKKMKDNSARQAIMSHDWHNMYKSNPKHNLPHLLFTRFAAMHCPCNLIVVKLTHISLSQSCTLLGCRELLLNLFFCCSNMETLHLDHCFSNAHLPADIMLKSEEEKTKHAANMWTPHEKQTNKLQENQFEESVEWKKSNHKLQFFLPHASTAHQVRVGDVLCELFAHAAFNAHSRHQPLPRAFTHLQELSINESGLSDYGVQALAAAAALETYTGDDEHDEHSYETQTKTEDKNDESRMLGSLRILCVNANPLLSVNGCMQLIHLLIVRNDDVVVEDDFEHRMQEEKKEHYCKDNKGNCQLEVLDIRHCGKFYERPYSNINNNDQNCFEERSDKESALQRLASTIEDALVRRLQSELHRLQSYYHHSHVDNGEKDDKHTRYILPLTILFAESNTPLPEWLLTYIHNTTHYTDSNNLKYCDKKHFNKQDHMESETITDGLFVHCDNNGLIERNYNEKLLMANMYKDNTLQKSPKDVKTTQGNDSNNLKFEKNDREENTHRQKSVEQLSAEVTEELYWHKLQSSNPTPKSVSCREHDEGNRAHTSSESSHTEAHLTANYNSNVKNNKTIVRNKEGNAQDLIETPERYVNSNMYLPEIISVATPAQAVNEQVDNVEKSSKATLQEANYHSNDNWDGKKENYNNIINAPYTHYTSLDSDKSDATCTHQEQLISSNDTVLNVNEALVMPIIIHTREANTQTLDHHNFKNEHHNTERHNYDGSPNKNIAGENNENQYGEEEENVITHPPMPESSESRTIAEIRNGSIHLIQSSWDESSPSANTTSVITATNTNVAKKECPLPISTKQKNAKSSSKNDEECDLANRAKMNNTTQSLSSQFVEIEQKGVEGKEEEDEMALVRSKLELSSPIAAVPLPTESSSRSKCEEEERKVTTSKIEENIAKNVANNAADNDNEKEENSADRWVTINNNNTTITSNNHNNYTDVENILQLQGDTHEVKLINDEVRVESKMSESKAEQMENKSKERKYANKTTHKDEVLAIHTQDDASDNVITPKSHKRPMRKPHSFSVYYQHPVGHLLCRTMHLLTSPKYGKATCHALQIDLQDLLQPSQNVNENKNNNADTNMIAERSKGRTKPAKTEILPEENKNAKGLVSVEWSTLDDSKSKICNDSDKFYEAREAESESNNGQENGENSGDDNNKNNTTTIHDRNDKSPFIIQVHSVEVITTSLQDKLHGVRLHHANKNMERTTEKSEQSLPQRYEEMLHSLFDKDEPDREKRDYNMMRNSGSAYNINKTGISNEEMTEQKTPIIRVKVTSNFSRIQLYDRLHRKLNVTSLSEQRKLLPHFMQVISSIANEDAVELIEEIALESPYAELILREEFDHSAAMAVHTTHYANGLTELLNRLLCKPTENEYESEKDAESVDVNEEMQHNAKHSTHQDEFNLHSEQEQEDKDEEEEESSPPNFNATKRPGMFDTESSKFSSSSESAAFHNPESLPELTNVASIEVIAKDHDNKNKTVKSEEQKEELTKPAESQNVVEVVAEPLVLERSYDNINNVNSELDNNHYNVVVEDVIHVAPLAVKENVKENTPTNQYESTMATIKSPKRQRSLTSNSSDNEVEVITSPLDVMKSVNIDFNKNVNKKKKKEHEDDDNLNLQITAKNNGTNEERRNQELHADDVNVTKNAEELPNEQKKQRLLEPNNNQESIVKNSQSTECEIQKQEVNGKYNVKLTFADPIRVERPLHNLSGALKTFVLPYSHLEGNAVCRAWNVLHRDDALSAQARQALEDDFLSLLQPNDKDLLHVVLSVHLHGVSACNSLDKDNLFANYPIKATTIEPAANGADANSDSIDQVNSDEGTPINLPVSSIPEYSLVPSLESNSPCTFLQLRVHTNERRVTLVRRLQRHTQELDDKYYLTSSSHQAPKPCPFPRLAYFLLCHPEEDTLYVMERFFNSSSARQIMKTHITHHYRNLQNFIHYTHFDPSLLLRELQLESMHDLYTFESKDNSDNYSDSWQNNNHNNNTITTKENEKKKKMEKEEGKKDRTEVLYGDMRKSMHNFTREKPLEEEEEHQKLGNTEEDEQQVEFVHTPLLHETDGHESDSALNVIVSPSTAASTPQASVIVSHSRHSLRRHKSSGSVDNTEINSGPQAMVMISPMSAEPNSPISFSLTNAHHTNTFATDDENEDENDDNVKNTSLAMSSDTNRNATANETLALPATNKAKTTEQVTNTLNNNNNNDNVNDDNVEVKQTTFDIHEGKSQEEHIETVVPLPSSTSLSSHRNSTELVYEDVKEPIQPEPQQKTNPMPPHPPSLGDLNEQLVQSELTPEHFRSESLSTTTFSAGANECDSAVQIPQAYGQHPSLEMSKEQLRQQRRDSHNRKYSLDDNNHHHHHTSTSHNRSKHRHRYDNRSSAEASGQRSKRSHHNSSNHKKEEIEKEKRNNGENIEEDDDGYSISTSRTNSSQRRQQQHGSKKDNVHDYHHARRVLSRRKTQSGSLSNSNESNHHHKENNNNSEDEMTNSQLEHLSSESYSEHRFRAEWKRRLEHKHRRLLRIAYDAMSRGNIALDPKHRDVHPVGKGKWLGQTVTLTLEWEILFVLTFTKSRPFSSTRKAQMLVHPVAFGFSAEQEDPDRKSAGRKRLILNIERAYRPSTVGIDYGAIEERLMQGALYTASGSSGNKDSVNNRSKTARQLLATPTNLTSSNNNNNSNKNENNNNNNTSSNNNNNAIMISRSTDLSSEMSASSTMNNAAMHFVARLIDDRIRLVIEMKTSKEVVRAANMLEDTVRRAQQAIERSMLANKDHNVSNETS